jgi:hypothetical protein
VRVDRGPRLGDIAVGTLVACAQRIEEIHHRTLPARRPVTPPATVRSARHRARPASRHVRSAIDQWRDRVPCNAIICVERFPHAQVT